MREGTRLAVDIYLPTTDGQRTNEQFPVLWTHERYHRAKVVDGKLTTPLDRSHRLQRFLKHGYAFACVDARGSGASFGSRTGPFSPSEQSDAYDITEWLATQSWCDGNVGMIGRSYGAITQFFAAATKPPHLKAIFPEMALFDLYAFGRPGGVLRDGYYSGWSKLVTELDTVGPAPTVDGDPAGALLEAARKQHQENIRPYDLLAPLEFRDSSVASGENPYLARSPAQQLRRINQSQVPVYQLAGWHDIFVRDAVLWHANLSSPKKIVIGPWCHTDTRGFDRFSEQLRWFDYWLKGKDNNVMDEGPIHYYVINARDRNWRSASVWPLPNQQLTDFFLSNTPSDSSAEAIAKTLEKSRPSVSRQEYTVDYTVTTGTQTRWTNGLGVTTAYDPCHADDSAVLTYTTRPLPQDVEVTGHPILNLWVSCGSQKIDIVAYLEDVNLQGESKYVTEGVLRSTHRHTQKPDFNNLGLPYHRGNQTDVTEELPSEPYCMSFDLLPISYVFHKGHRIRVAVASADTGNLATITQTPPATLNVHHGGENASRITLPIIP